MINNPSQFPDPFIVEQYLEPMVLGTIITPGIHLFQLFLLKKDHFLLDYWRGIQMFTWVPLSRWPSNEGESRSIRKISTTRELWCNLSFLWTK